MKIFAIGKPNKKADLSLSINAIVIVVLAMTLLGLGLGFIRGMFKNITETTGEISEQVRQQILEDLRTGNKKLSFPSSEISVDKGSAKIIAFGIKNTKAIEDLNFKINIKILEAQIAGESITGATAENITDIDFFYDKTAKALKVTEADVYSIRLTATGRKGVYMSKIEVMETDDNGTIKTGMPPYAEKTFFINII
jgi:hypothetical protein